MIHKIKTRRQRLLPVLITMIFAAVGSYIVSISDAATYEDTLTYFDTTISSVRTGDTAVYSFNGSRPNLGQTTCYTDPVTGSYECYEDYETNVYIIRIHTDSASVRYANMFSCGNYGTCSGPVIEPQYITVCIAWDSSYPSVGQTKLFDIAFQDTDRDSENIVFDHFADTAINGVTCQNNDAMTGQLRGTREFAKAPYPVDMPVTSPNGNTGIGTGGQGAGVGQNGTGDGAMNTSNASNGSGGSSAVRSSDQQNTVSVLTAQGEQAMTNNQAPSPFFDGVQYQSGGIFDSAERTINNATKRFSVLLPLSLFVVMLASVGGYLAIRRYRVRK